MLTVGQIISKTSQDPQNGTVFRDIGFDPGACTHLYETRDGWTWGTATEDRTKLSGSAEFRSIARHADGDLLVVEVEPQPEQAQDTPTPKRAEILREAERLITGDRNQTYGEPMENFSIIAEYWNTFLSHKLKDGEKITPGDTAGMQVLVKLAREKGGPKEDNKLDIAGYAACWAEVDG